MSQIIRDTEEGKTSEYEYRQEEGEEHKEWEEYEEYNTAI